MAGEKKGKTYEAILKVVLDELIAKGDLKGPLFWNERPAGMTIEPDFTLGRDCDHPTHVFLVTHSGSAKDSEKKFWRNIGELAEAKTRIAKEPIVISIAFDSVMKADLKAIQSTTFDAQLVVGDSTYGQDLQRWVDTNAAQLPKDGDEKADAIRAAMRDKQRTDNPKDLIGKLRRDVKTTVCAARPQLSDLWALLRKHQAVPVPGARDTFVRRGMMKAALLGGIPSRKLNLSPAAATIADALKMSRKQDIAKASVAGVRLADRDVVWLANSVLQSTDVSRLVAKYATDGFRRQIQKLRSVAALPHLVKFLADNLQSLSTSKGMLAALKALHKDPGAGVRLPHGVAVPDTLWLFDIVGAISKSSSGKAQDFGYSTFAKHPDAGSSKVGNMLIGTWCSCFMNQYFNRKTNFRAPDAAVAFCARVLADSVASFSATTIAATMDEIREQYINKELEVGLLTHRGFDPIGALLLEEFSRAGLDAKSVTVQAGFAERAAMLGTPLDSRSAGSSLLTVSSTGISWQSAHDSHTNDKRKELCGRAPALRYTWDSKKRSFIKRPSTDKLILIVDGTWRQEDLNALVRAGWDDIFYPDEMDKLVKAIV